MLDLEHFYGSFKPVMTLDCIKSTGSVLFSLDSACSCLIVFACMILGKTELKSVLHVMCKRLGMILQLGFE